MPAFLPGRTPGSACRAGAVVDFRGRIETVAMYRARRDYKAAIFPVLCRQARRSGSPFALLGAGLEDRLAVRAASLRGADWENGAAECMRAG